MTVGSENVTRPDYMYEHLNISTYVEKYEAQVNMVGEGETIPGLAGRHGELYDAGTDLIMAAFREGERMRFNTVVDENARTCLVCASIMFQMIAIAGFLGAVDPRHLDPSEVKEILSLRYESIGHALILWHAHNRLLLEEVGQ